MKKIIKWVLIGFIAVIIIGAISSKGSSPKQNTETGENKTTTKTEETANKKEEVIKIEPIVLKGTGQQATEKFRLETGLSVFKMTHSGNSNFIVYLLDTEGNKVELLVNKIGVFNGSKAIKINKAGDYLLDITAGGQWTVNIEQPRANEAPKTNTFNGSGQQTTELFSTEKGLKTVKMTHSGSSNFIVYLQDKSGNKLELLVNEIGPFDGSKAVKIARDGIYLFDVEAEGNWQISF